MTIYGEHISTDVKYLGITGKPHIKSKQSHLVSRTKNRIKFKQQNENIDFKK